VRLSKEEQLWWKKIGIVKSSSHNSRLKAFEKEFSKFEKKYKKLLNVDAYEKRFQSEMAELHSNKKLSDSSLDTGSGTDSGESQEAVSKSMSSSSMETPMLREEFEENVLELAKKHCFDVRDFKSKEFEMMFQEFKKMESNSANFYFELFDLLFKFEKLNTKKTNFIRNLEG
jgi:hypothetical protein